MNMGVNHTFFLEEGLQFNVWNVINSFKIELASSCMGI